ncbi:hypothetical protein QC764_307155 [Podospora pseudoanserina]|uniref:Uncharacterized protein n=1 Tax=Podospora pseudoanserina TaxID=2609844 RepID=A0ABR0IDF4_9PEZI|nr:hypothetical protein QC764_307155 [Podospora pseudoanserina]
MFKAAVSHYISSPPSSLVAGLGASSMEHEVGTKGPRGRSVNLRTRQYTDDIIHVPAPCFSVCDTAYLEAQMVGKDPELCEEDSVFYSSYNECRMCIRDMSDYGMYGITEREYLTPTFQPWLDYCESLPPVQYMTSTDMPTSTPTTPATIVKVPESTDKPVIDISPATSPQTPRAAPIPSTPPPNEEPIAPSTVSQPTFRYLASRLLLPLLQVPQGAAQPTPEVLLHYPVCQRQYHGFGPIVI